MISNCGTMNHAILFVEDDLTLRGSFSEFFVRRRYDVVGAVDGFEALDAMRITEQPFSLIVLDLRMPRMSGMEFLDRLHTEFKSPPPVVVLSAYFDAMSVDLCIEFGVRCMFNKPFEWEPLHDVISAILDKDHCAFDAIAKRAEYGISTTTNDHAQTILFKLSNELKSNIKSGDITGSIIRAREEALYDYFEKHSTKNVSPSSSAKEPVLIVARRWNSWYPSFFDVPGGAYAIVGPRTNKKRGECAVLDPGFRCLEVLRSVGVSVADIQTCIMSHNHPDHIAGVFELMAARHALGKRTKGLCNETTRTMFGDCSSFSFELSGITANMYESLFTYTHGRSLSSKVSIKGFETAHREMGNSNCSLGISVSCRADNAGNSESYGTAVILGDTEFDPQQHSHLISELTKSDVRFVVLHVGSVQMKRGDGKHLYYPGLKKVLSRINNQLDDSGRTGTKLPVLVSEWGLEHATRDQICKICGCNIDGFDNESPMLNIMKLNDNEMLPNLTVIPADIGLTIGLETGKVYLPNHSGPVPVEEVRVGITDEGLVYGL